MAEKNTKKGLRKELNIGFIRDVDILDFTKNLSISLKSGITIVDALEMQREQAKGKFKMIITDMVQTVSSGISFYNALKKYPKYFDSFYVNLVKTGEQTGNLEENLNRVGDHLSKSYKVKKKVKGAMIYPLFAFIAILGLGTSIIWFVFPKILPIFERMDLELPLSTKVLLSISHVFENHGWQAALIMAFSVFAIFKIARLKILRPYTHWLILHIPLIRKISRSVNLERLSRSFGTLIESGLTVNESLRILCNTFDNQVYNKAISQIIPQIECGDTLNNALAKYPKLFPLTAYKIIGIGEMTGNLDQSLSYLADFYEDEVDDVIKNLSTIIEPVLLIVIGLMVGLVAISIIGPIYQITGSVRM